MYLVCGFMSPRPSASDLGTTGGPYFWKLSTFKTQRRLVPGAKFRSNNRRSLVQLGINTPEPFIKGVKLIWMFARK